MLSLGAQLFMSQACEAKFIMGILLWNSKLNYTLWSGHVLGSYSSYSPMLICRSVDRVQISIALPIVVFCFDLPLVSCSGISYMYMYMVQIYIYRSKITSNICSGWWERLVYARILNSHLSWERIIPWKWKIVSLIWNIYICKNIKSPSQMGCILKIWTMLSLLWNHLYLQES